MSRYEEASVPCPAPHMRISSFPWSRPYPLSDAEHEKVMEGIRAKMTGRSVKLTEDTPKKIGKQPLVEWEDLAALRKHRIGLFEEIENDSN